MADLLLATNLVPRPLPTVGTATSSAWVKQSGAACQINGMSSRGNQVIGVMIEGTGYAHAPLGSVESSELSYIINVSGGTAAFTGEYTVSLVSSLTAALEDETGHSAAHSVTAGKVESTITGALAVPPGETVFLRVRCVAGSSTHGNLHAARVSPEPITDELGIFDGDIPDTEELRYEWLGDPELSASQVWAIGAAPDPDPDPGPEPGHADMVLRVLRKLNRADDVELIDACTEHVELVTEYVRGYTRGRGFDPATDEPARGLQAVIVGAAAKLTSNPEQVSYFQTGDYSERPAVLAGWTLPELAILNNFRRRQS